MSPTLLIAGHYLHFLNMNCGFWLQFIVTILNQNQITRTLTLEKLFKKMTI